MKLVIADDELFIRQTYQAGFADAGYEIFVAEDGIEALKLIKEEIPDLILLDLIMPRMDGFEVLKNLRSDEKLHTIPVMVLSNLSQPSDEEEVKKLGAIDFIVKSDYSLDQILEKIRIAVGTQTQAA